MKFLRSRSNKALDHDIAVNGAAAERAEPDLPASEKQDPAVAGDYYSDPISEAPSLDVQEGVKKAEAVTLTWTRNELIMAYGL